MYAHFYTLAAFWQQTIFRNMSAAGASGDSGAAGASGASGAAGAAGLGMGCLFLRLQLVLANVLVLVFAQERLISHAQEALLVRAFRLLHVFLVLMRMPSCPAERATAPAVVPENTRDTDNAQRGVGNI